MLIFPTLMAGNFSTGTNFFRQSGNNYLLRQLSSSASPSQWGGDSEDYQLNLYRGPPINNAVAVQNWAGLIHNLTSSPTGYVDKFDWKVFHLDFAFGNLNDSVIADSYYNQTDMDGVISYLSAQGFSVILSDYNWAGFGSSTWVQDWLNVAQHYKGNNDILAFDLFAEPESGTWSSNVTTMAYSSSEGVESAYSNLTTRIQAIDPTRTVVWYSPYFNLELDPAFEKSNVVYDFHLYANVSSGTSWSTNRVNDEVTFDNQYGVQSVCLELNAQGSAGTNFTLTEYQINLMNQNGIAWNALLYSEYSQDWIPILNNASTQITTSSTTESVTQTTTFPVSTTANHTESTSTSKTTTSTVNSFSSITTTETHTISVTLPSTTTKISTTTSPTKTYSTTSTLNSASTTTENQTSTTTETSNATTTNATTMISNRSTTYFNSSTDTTSHNQSGTWNVSSATASTTSQSNSSNSSLLQSGQNTGLSAKIPFAAGIGVGTSLVVFMVGLFPLSYLLKKEEALGKL
jgi:hypothetical protein